MKKEFPKETLKDVLWEDAEGFEKIKDELIDSSRWSLHYELVFKHENKFYKTHYSCGATESQDERPFEYEPDMIECTEVMPVEKTIIEYVKVK